MSDMPLEATPPESTPPERPTFVTIGLDSHWLRRALVVVFAAVILWQLLQWSWGALAGFAFNILLSFLIAMSFDPLISALVRRGWKRGLATALVLGIVYLLSAGFLVLFGSLFAQQLGQLVSTLPQIITEIVTWLNGTFGLSIDAAAAIEAATLTPEQLGVYASQWQGGILGFLTGVLNIFVNVVIIVIFSFYLAADAPQIRRTIASWMPHSSQRVVITVWDIAIEKAGAFVLSKIILATLASVVYSAFFFFIGVPFWLPMGVFVGFVSQFIPMIGTYIGLAVPIVFTLAVNPLNALWIVIFATAYQQVDTYLLTPRLANKVMSLNSGLSLAAVFIGAALFGPVGAIIGIPLLAIVLAVAETYGRRYDLVPELARPGEYEDPNVTGGQPPVDPTR